MTATPRPLEERVLDVLAGHGPRVVSYGGGVQSTALLVLAAQRVIDFPTFLFANVGDDSEHPASLEYVREVAMPYGEAHGIGVHELHRVMRDGTTRTLYGQLTKAGTRSIGIPVRVANGAPGTRQCTFDYKFRVIDRWLREHGATEATPATVAIGFSTDEIERVKQNTGRTKRVPQEKVYPLLDLGLNRDRCRTVIADAGLPVPPKSSCYFCPFHRPSTWQTMAREEPDLFWKSVDLERRINRTRDAIGKDHVYLTRFGRPLDEVVDDSQQAFDFEGPEGCDDGYCWT